MDNLGTCSLYIDGVQDPNNYNYTPASTLTLNQTAVGVLYRTTIANFVTGNVYGVNTYNVALNPAQVRTRMNGSYGSLAPTLTWTLDTSFGGTTAFDTSGGGNGGTISGIGRSPDVPAQVHVPTTTPNAQSPFSLYFNGSTTVGVVASPEPD